MFRNSNKRYSAFEKVGQPGARGNERLLRQGEVLQSSKTANPANSRAASVIDNVLAKAGQALQLGIGERLVAQLPHGERCFRRCGADGDARSESPGSETGSQWLPSRISKAIQLPHRGCGMCIAGMESGDGEALGSWNTGDTRDKLNGEAGGKVDTGECIAGQVHREK
jgi:hypothetical protein